MYQTFADWYYGFMNWFLKQTPESTSAEDPFKRLNVKTAIYTVNMVVDSLVLDNPERYEEIYKYIFDGDTNYLRLPADIARVFAYYDETRGDWALIKSARDRRAKIRKASDSQIYNEDGWVRGDQIELLVAKYPPRVMSENDIIYFPRGHYELLNLRVADVVFYQSGQAMPANLLRRLSILEAKWKTDLGVVNAEITPFDLSYKGIGG